MPTAKSCPRLLLVVLSVCFSIQLTSLARAQYKIDLQTCEDIKITETHYGINTVETATCVNPTKTFKPKGTMRNVFIVATFPSVPTGTGITFMVTKNDANGEYVDKQNYVASPQHTTAYIKNALREEWEIGSRVMSCDGPEAMCLAPRLKRVSNRY